MKELCIDGFYFGYIKSENEELGYRYVDEEIEPLVKAIRSHKGVEVLKSSVGAPMYGEDGYLILVFDENPGTELVGPFLYLALSGMLAVRPMSVPVKCEIAWLPWEFDVDEEDVEEFDLPPTYPAIILRWSARNDAETTQVITLLENAILDAPFW